MKLTHTSKILLPSTFSIINQTSLNILDANYYFWQNFLDLTQIKHAFFTYLKNYNPQKDEKIFMKYIINNYKKILNSIIESFINKNKENETLEYFKVLFFIINILNTINKNIIISLPYGINYKNLSVEKDLKSIFSNKHDYLLIFLNNLVNSNPMIFTDSKKYIFTLKWENELAPALIFAKLLITKFKNIECVMDLTSANEQLNFSFWTKNYLTTKYFNNFLLDSQKPLQIKKHPKIIQIHGTTLLVKRLLNTKCFWSKCTFCTINSNYNFIENTSCLNQSTIKEINKLIQYILKNHHIQLLVLTDEAIEADILFYLAKELIKNKIKINWSARTRLSIKLSKENCQLLGKSGLKFLGLGLESVNDRIINLMNKRNEYISKITISEILVNLDKYGVNPHAYFILGFPSETKHETDETIQFILDHLYKLRFFTYSANIFSLMKGSYIFNNPEKFGIRILEQNNSLKLSNINYSNLKPKNIYSYPELTDICHELYARIFFYTGYESKKHIGFHFWDYIDRISSFYHYKLTNNSNPFWR